MKTQSAITDALRIMQHLHMAQVEDMALQSATIISDEIGITYSCFIRLSSLLRKKGLAATINGRNGGLALSKPSSEISVYDVYLAIEGEMQMHRCISDESKPRAKCGTRNFFCRLQEDTIHNMKMQSIADFEFPANVKPRLHPLPQYVQNRSSTEAPQERYYHIVTVDKREHRILVDDILLFHSDAKTNTLEIHTQTEAFQIRRQHKKIAEIGSEFFPISRECMVNLNHVKLVDGGKKEVHLSDWRTVPIVSYKVGSLLKRLLAHRSMAG